MIINMAKVSAYNATSKNCFKKLETGGIDFLSSKMTIIIKKLIKKSRILNIKYSEGVTRLLLMRPHMTRASLCLFFLKYSSWLQS